MLNGHAELTSSVNEPSDVFFQFIGHAQEITMLVLFHLSDARDVEASERFEVYHHDDQPSLNTLALF